MRQNISRMRLKYLEESQSVVYVGQAWAWLGYAHCLMGDPKTAVDLTEKGLKMHTDLGMPFLRSMCHWLLQLCPFRAWATWKKHERMPSWPCNSRWKTMKDMWQGLSRIWLGRVLAKTDPTQIEAAEQHILQGISLLEELGIEPFAGLGYLWLGEVYAESGRREEALENLKKAETMFREMGMDYWLGKAQEALAKM